MNYRVLSFIFLFFSCGLKVTNEINENVLLGTWQLERIKCYGPTSSVIALEDYIITGEADVVIEFFSNRFEYNASSEVGAGCSTSGIANYKTSFDGDGDDDLSFSKLTNSGNCSVDIVDVESGLTVNIPLLVDSEVNEDLSWRRQKQILDFQLMTSFVGSNEGECKQQCTCIGKYNKID